MEMATFGFHFFKKSIVFILLFQHVFCQDLNEPNWIADGPNPSQDNLINPLFTDPRLRQIRSTDDKENSSNGSELTKLVSKIKLGEIEEAAKYYDDVRKSVSLADVLNVTYNSEDVQDELLNFRFMLDFVRAIRPCIKTYKVAIKTINQLLQSTSNLDPLKGVLFYHLLQISYQESKDHSIQDIIEAATNTYYRNFLDRCVNVIHTGVDDEKLKNFTLNVYYYPYINTILPPIFMGATEAKSDIENSFDHILHFIHNYLWYYGDWPLAYSHLYEHLEKHDLLSNKTLTDKLGKAVKNYMESPRYNKVEQLLRDRTQNLCNSLESCKS